jgi:hypothetical protein
MKLWRKNWKEKNKNSEKERVRQKNERFRKNNPNYGKEKSLQTKYGLSYTDYVSLYNDQEGRCKLCNRYHPLESSVFTEILNVDHCHLTNKVRGLLCHKCNKALGLFSDDVKILQKAIQYLKENQNSVHEEG